MSQPDIAFAALIGGIVCTILLAGVHGLRLHIANREWQHKWRSPNFDEMTTEQYADVSITGEPPFIAQVKRVFDIILASPFAGYLRQMKEIEQGPRYVQRRDGLLHATAEKKLKIVSIYAAQTKPDAEFAATVIHECAHLEDERPVCTTREREIYAKEAENRFRAWAGLKPDHFKPWLY